MISTHRALLVLVICCAGCSMPALLAFPEPDRAPGSVQATLPSGREIHPLGDWVRLAPYPFALTLRPDGSEAAIPSIGFPFALNLVSHLDAATRTVRQLPASKQDAAGVETHAGLVYSPDGSLLYVATGDSGKVAIYTTADWKKTGEISLDAPVGNQRFSGSFAATLLLSHSGQLLYVLDQGNWRVVVLDTVRREVVGSVATGAYPFALALSPDQQRLYVTNTGLFEYKAIEEPPSARGQSESSPLRGIRFPPTGYPSVAARSGGIVEGKRVPGLGDENATRGSSLWTYLLADARTPVMTAKLRLGPRIVTRHGETMGGAAPTGVVASDDAVYVALAHDDAVAKVSADGARLLAQAELSPFEGARFRDSQGRHLRGVMPSGIALGGGRLYVAESGINAVAVLDPGTLQVKEHIPVGWNPSAVALSPDAETLYVVNTKGRGTGPNGGAAHDSSAPSYVGALEYGSLSIIALRSLAPAAELTATVVAANAAGLRTQNPMPRLKHCFLIIRENRTYDEVLGDLPGANGDPSLARYGLRGWTGEKPEGASVSVTPNLHALAQQYGSSDNFFVDSDVSADGHRWVIGINPTPFFNTAWSSNYGGRRTSSADAPQPGRRAMFGGNDGPMPEDEPQFGSLWEHIVASHKGVLNYGEGLELEGNQEGEGKLPEGQRLLLNAPVPLPVFEASDRRFPTFNLGIPDQMRAAEFEHDFSRRLARAAAGSSDSSAIPALVVIRLPGDHGAKPRPVDGYPYVASYMADNDLALGKIISYLSGTPIWKDSAVFVTEDDAQGGVDHVDAHRSVLVVASPHVRAGAIAHERVDMGSIIRTIDELLGLPSMNLEDALSGELTSLFSAPGDAALLERYKVRDSDLAVFDPLKARVAQPKTVAEREALRDMDDPAEIQPEVERTAAARRAIQRKKAQGVSSASQPASQ